MGHSSSGSQVKCLVGHTVGHTGQVDHISSSWWVTDKVDHLPFVWWLTCVMASWVIFIKGQVLRPHGSQFRCLTDHMGQG